MTRHEWISRARLAAMALAASATMTLGACGGKNADTSRTAAGDVATPPAMVPATTDSAPNTALLPADTASIAPKHHSKLAGAALGAVAGHYLGGHAVAGAAVGALVQHERNKHSK